MRRIAAVLMITLLLLAGCASGAQVSYGQIQSVTVSFELPDGLYRSVTVDVERSIHVVTDFDGGIAAQRELPFERTRELTQYLQANVLPAITEGKGQGSAEEKLILWEVKVFTDTGSYIEKGFEGDGFPSYWEELLKLLGQKTTDQ